jgi:ABC-type sulfate/molybdate transport systems ATPase subunit
MAHALQIDIERRYPGGPTVRARLDPLLPGSTTVLFGPSGAGKSTVLRCVAGLDRPDAGRVSYGSQLWSERAVFLPPQARRVGYLFQDYALFPHLTVAQNVGYGLREASRRAAVVPQLLERFGLSGLADRRPTQLSGGQAQRVALARALAPRPRLLLLDEPFGAVDAKVREELRRWLRKLHDEVHTTSIFVTHDQEEAFAIADRVMIISRGRLEQAGRPEEILDSPSTEFVARFVGDVNVIPGVMIDGLVHAGRLVAAVVDPPPPGPVHLVVRSYDLKFWAEQDGPAVVRRIMPLGDRVRVEAWLDDIRTPIFAQFPRRSSLLQGVEVGARIAVQVTHARAWSQESSSP